MDRRRSARYLPRAPQVCQEIPRCDSATDVVLRERSSGWANDACAFLYAPACERNVRGDHDVVSAHMFSDPVIGGIEPVADDFECDPLFIRNAHPGVGHQGHFELISPSDSKHFLLDRTRIRIDKYVQQAMLLWASPQQGGCRTR